MELENLQSRVAHGVTTGRERVTHGVEELRDRTADLVGGEGGSLFRELGRLGRRIDDARGATEQRIGAAETSLGERIDELTAAHHRTTWPRRLFWLLFGTAAGLAAGYLGDPDRGRTRRTQLNDQLGARGREMAEEMRKRAKIASDRTRGQVIERVKGAMPEDVPSDPQLLEQRIKSDVFGHRDDTSDVVILIDAPGTVALRGTVPSATSERELLAAVSGVDGVIDVRSELEVAGS